MAALRSALGPCTTTASGANGRPWCAVTGESHVFEKTRFCKFHLRGRCRRGQQCTFAHSDIELQPRPDYFKTQLCIDYFRTANCSMGAECRYAHSPEEIRQVTMRKGCETVGRRDSAMPSRHERTQESGPSEIEAVQAQLRAIEQQLRQLQQTQASSAPSPSQAVSGSSLRMSPAPMRPMQAGLLPMASAVQRDFGHSHGKSPSATTFSRQSTADEPPSPQEDTFDRRVSEDDVSWCSDPESAEVPTIDIGDAEEAEYFDCELVVKRTFLNLVPNDHPAARPHSCPATPRSGR
mmetsp:Transcript_19509/g.56756  ORF Transcript_19509/g.56756 Transcript_19509/m.56756 type:complete len:293 (-) Transcript_19509:46-924(-)